jgi:shikimate kinase
MTEEITSPEKPCARRKAAAVSLVGFMGAGKTTVGRALAHELDWGFLDLDDLVEQRTGRSIDEIFRQEGENGFRALEHVALREVLDGARGPLVLALGGGAFIEARNRELLFLAGVPAIFLDAPLEELLRRCREASLARPLLGGQHHFSQLYHQRRPVYLEALVSIDTGGRQIASVVEEIISVLGLRGHLGARE